MAISATTLSPAHLPGESLSLWVLVTPTQILSLIDKSPNELQINGREGH